jgi:hypothetical protein
MNSGSAIPPTDDQSTNIIPSLLSKHSNHGTQTQRSAAKTENVHAEADRSGSLSLPPAEILRLIYDRDQNKNKPSQKKQGVQANGAGTPKVLHHPPQISPETKSLLAMEFPSETLSKFRSNMTGVAFLPSPSSQDPLDITLSATASVADASAPTSSWMSPQLSAQALMGEHYSQLFKEVQPLTLDDPQGGKNEKGQEKEKEKESNPNPHPNRDCDPRQSPSPPRMALTSQGSSPGRRRFRQRGSQRGQPPAISPSLVDSLALSRLQGFLSHAVDQYHSLQAEDDVMQETVSEHDLLRAHDSKCKLELSSQNSRHYMADQIRNVRMERQAILREKESHMAAKSERKAKFFSRVVRDLQSPPTMTSAPPTPSSHRKDNELSVEMENYLLKRVISKELTTRKDQAFRDLRDAQTKRYKSKHGGELAAQQRLEQEILQRGELKRHLGQLQAEVRELEEEASLLRGKHSEFHASLQNWRDLKVAADQAESNNQELQLEIDSVTAANSELQRERDEKVDMQQQVAAMKAHVTSEQEKITCMVGLLPETALSLSAKKDMHRRLTTLVSEKRKQHRPLSPASPSSPAMTPTR